MQSRRAVRVFIAALVTSWVAFATAAPRDRAATEKIDEAINKHYLATEFDKAQAVLTGTLEACADRCSPEIKAKAHMYIGIVQGSGKGNIRGAQEAFQQALALDPKVKLDDALATPDVRDAFAAAAAALGQTEPAAAGPAPAAEGESGDEDLEGDMECTPSVKEVETGRVIPVACTTDEPASKVTLRYKVFGGDTWATVAMKRKGEYWIGEVPCADTGISGKLRWFVRAQDSGGDTVDSYGSKKTPADINLVSTTDEDPPNYPGQVAPPKCMDAAACPDEMIGTPACPGTGGKGGRGSKGWGAPCDTSNECETGLLCLQGDAGRSCESAPTCDSDADCPGGHVCKSGSCDIGDDDGGGATGPYKRHWLGLHIGLDLAYLTGDDICSFESQDAGDFTCFYGNGEQFPNDVPPGGGGKVGGGIAAATVPIMASYEFGITPNIGIEGRVGAALLVGPSPASPLSYLHLEARGKYWFGSNALGKKGIRPYVGLGGGLAQVDAKIEVRIADCGSANPCDAPQRTNVALDAYRRLGMAFIAGGGGAMYAFAPNHGVVLNVNLMLTIPSVGFVVEPTLGYQFGL